MFYLSQILHYLPQKSILCSATLPQTSELSNIVKNYIDNYNGNVIEIISNKTLIGCVIKDFDDNIITPHDYCNNGKELSLLIDKIKWNICRL